MDQYKNQCLQSLWRSFAQQQTFSILKLIELQRRKSLLSSTQLQMICDSLNVKHPSIDCTNFGTLITSIARSTAAIIEQKELEVDLSADTNEFHGCTPMQTQLHRPGGCRDIKIPVWNYLFCTTSKQYGGSRAKAGWELKLAGCAVLVAKAFVA